MTLHIIQPQQQQNKLKDKLYLLDQNTSKYFGTRPKKLFLDLIDVLPIDSKDETILEYSIKNNLIIVTCDVKFTVEILLSSKNVIFQTNNNERFYFKVKEFKKLSVPQKNTFEKILDSVIYQNKKSYIADSLNTSRLIGNISNPCEKIKGFFHLKDHIKINVLINYVKHTKSIIVTSSKHNFFKSLFALNKCVFADEKLDLNYLSVDYFKFENVTYDRKRLAIRNYENKSSDCLHDNIRFIRKNIDEIEKNLNFVECELIKRKELEAQRELESLQVPTSNLTKGID